MTRSASHAFATCVAKVSLLRCVSIWGRGGKGALPREWGCSLGLALWGRQAGQGLQQQQQPTLTPGSLPPVRGVGGRKEGTLTQPGFAGELSIASAGNALQAATESLVPES